MARGWESKSVEAQQAEAAQNSEPGPKLTPAQAAREREKEGLRLSRKRILQQISTSQNPRYQKLLQDALAELDDKLGKL